MADVRASSTNNVTLYDESGNQVTVPNKTNQSSRPLSIADYKDGGRTYWSFYADQTAAVTSSDALISCSYCLGGTVTTAQTSYTVTAGKTLRVLYAGATINGNATNAMHIAVRLRAAASSITVTSALVFPMLLITGNSAGSLDRQDVEIPEGMEFAAGTQIALSGQVTVGVTTTNILTVRLIGYEY